MAYAWVVVLALLVMGPALLPGFVLSYDLVFTPRQDLLPASIGVGSGLPRAVPQDAVVAIIETVVPGMLLEKAVLLGIVIIAGSGMLRLLPGTAAGVVAATVAIANPFVAQRLVIGHWGFLLAYALVPWAIALARRLRVRGDAWDGLRLLLVIAAGSLTPSGSLLLAAVALPPVLLPRSAYAVRERVLLGAAVVATWLPWMLPALLHPGATGAGVEGARVFALRADGPAGVVVSALTGGGIWNSQVVLPSRATALAWVMAAFLIALAAWGARELPRILGRGVTAWWALVAIAGLLATLASALLLGPWAALLDAVPGGGLARDAHKLLAPWVLLIAVAAGAGAGRALLHVRERGTRTAAILALVVVPLACQPDLLWGAGGRLQAVAYPSDWASARGAIGMSERPGDVASFPWTAFRAFPWNDDRTVLDPAPRWLPRTTVTSDALVVDSRDGLVTIEGDDPRAATISRALASGESVGEILPAEGIGWALVARGTPGPVPELPGWELVLDGSDLALYAAPEGTVAERSVDARLVGGVDLALAAGLLTGLAALAIRRVRVRERRPLVP